MIKVIKAGFNNTVQDKGRFGYASLGVPISGTMDSYSADLANNLLNNSLDAAVLELVTSNCEFQFLCNTMICITGADFSPKVNGVSISMNSRVSIHKDDSLSFGKIKYGVRCYVAVSDGVQSESVLDSRSFFVNITQSSILKKGDILPIVENFENTSISKSKLKINNNLLETNVLECYKGPEYHLLPQNLKEQIFKTDITISKDNSRMGYKFKEKLQNNLPQILTSSVLPGTIQLTPSGILIALMKDCQTTGGYPRILQLAEKSIQILAQKTTNKTVQFSCISI